MKRCCERAIANGFDIKDNSTFYDRYFDEGKSNGRPRKCTSDMNEKIASYVCESKTRREVTLNMLGHEFELA